MKLTADKMRALLAKLRMGADASLTMARLFEVLDHLGGWRVEECVGFVHDPVEGRSFIAKRKEEEARRAYEALKLNEVAELPAVAQASTNYYLNVDPFGSWDAASVTIYGTHYTHVRGMGGYRLTSPDGKSREFYPDWFAQSREAIPTRKDLRPYELLPWLKAETSYLADVSAKLGLEVHKPAAPRTRDHTGSCPACLGNFKIVERPGSTKPVMVLHGYERPGYGFAIGKCFGVKYPPLELSTEGTVHYVEYLKRNRAQTEDYLRRLRSGEVVELRDVLGRARVKADLDERTWTGVMDNVLRHEEHVVAMLTQDIARLTKIVDTWAERPLPKEGDPLSVW